MNDLTLKFAKSKLVGNCDFTDSLTRAKSHNAKKILEKMINYSPEAKDLVDQIFAHRTANKTIINFDEQLLAMIRKLLSIESNVALWRLAMTYFVINACTNENFKRDLHFLSEDFDWTPSNENIEKRKFCRDLSSIETVRNGFSYIANEMKTRLPDLKFSDEISVGSIVYSMYKNSIKLFVVESIIENEIRVFDSREIFYIDRSLFNHSNTLQIRPFSQEKLMQSLNYVPNIKTTKKEFSENNNKENGNKESYKYIPDPNDPFAGSMNSPTYGNYLADLGIDD